MATILGIAFLWLIGNRDALLLLVCFAFGLSLIHLLISAWRFAEGRDD